MVSSRVKSYSDVAQAGSTKSSSIAAKICAELVLSSRVKSYSDVTQAGSKQGLIMASVHPHFFFEVEHRLGEITQAKIILGRGVAICPWQDRT